MSASHDARVARLFVDANERPETTKVHVSPSGTYRLTVTGFATGPKSWNYTRGTVTRSSDNATIAVVHCNYSSFPFAWIEPHANGHAYLVCNEDYQGQTVVELDTGERVDHLPEEAGRGHAFCWARITPNADGTMLSVHGCHWACPYETLIVDFTQPLQPPWKQLHRCDEDFGEWVGLNSCTTGRMQSIVRVPSDAPPTILALDGKEFYEGISDSDGDALAAFEIERGLPTDSTIHDELTASGTWTRPIGTP